MNEITLPASPNWYLSSIIACANDGTVVWGARNSIIVAKKKENSKELQYTIFDKAHSQKVVSLAFSPWDEENKCYYLVSAGEDNIIKIWNMDFLILKTQFILEVIIIVFFFFLLIY